MFSDEIAARLRHARASLGLSRRELASASGISAHVIESFERGRNLGTVRKFLRLGGTLQRLRASRMRSVAHAR